jgi:hypothetical protein
VIYTIRHDDSFAEVLNEINDARFKMDYKSPYMETYIEAARFVFNLMPEDFLIDALREDMFGCKRKCFFVERADTPLFEFLLSDVFHRTSPMKIKK